MLHSSDWPKAQELIKNGISELILSAVQHSAFGVTIADATRPDCPLIYVNDAFSRLTGYGAEDVIGKNCRFLQGEDTDPKAVERIREFVRLGISGTCLLLNYHRDGSKFWNRFQLSPISSSCGKVQAFLGVAIDVTEDVARGNREVERQRLETIGRMSSDYAHELNNALLPIQLHADELGDSLDTSQQNAIAHFVELQKGVAHARDVAGRILSFARHSPPTTSQKTLPLSIVLDAVNFAANQLPKTMASVVHPFDQDLEDGALGLRVDPVKLKQVISNLFVNAVHATSAVGRIDVRITRKSLGPKNLATAVHMGPWLELEVSDNGCGMDVETRRRAFEPFFTTKPEGEGTGLGLSTIALIIESWGGSVELQTHPGLGSNFSLYFPILSSPEITER